MSKKILFLPILILILFSYFNYAKAEVGLLYLGDDNVYYTCQGKVVSPVNDDNSENNDMVFDLESVRILNDTFFIDKNGVYFVGTFNYYCYFYKLNGADKNSFQILNNVYEKDESNVYHNSFYHGGPIIDKIENADSSTFEVFTEDKDYAMDENNIYYQGKIIGENETNIADDDLYSSLRGKIILQAEQNGEAYYVSPDKQKMYFLSRPIIAFKVMREQGIGITNSDLEKIPVSNSYCPDYKTDCDNLNAHDASFAKNQRGKIFLQVEGNGEAWYVNPSNAKRYFLGRPNDAFNIMRNLGLGINNKDYNKMIALEIDTMNFIGIITNVEIDCIWDGACSVEIDNKWNIVIVAGGFRSPNSQPKITGDVIDIKFDSEKSSIGKNIEVYARRIGENQLSVFGSKEYYVRVIKKGI